MDDVKLFDDVPKETIADDERLAFQKENVAGANYITWANLKALLKTLFVWLGNVDQTIDGIKSFVKSPLVPDPTTDLQAVNYRTLNRATGGIQNFIQLLDVKEGIPNYEGLGGRKVVIRADENGVTTMPSTTLSGFVDRENISVYYNPVTNELSLTAISGTFEFITINGTSYKKTNDSIALSVIDGLMYIYYDNDGVLKQYDSPSRDQQYDLMTITLPVSYVEYSPTLGEYTVAGYYLKGEESVGLWVKNFFDLSVRKLEGLTVFGLTGGTGNDDADARFGLSVGSLIFSDIKYLVPQRETTDAWNVGYFDANKKTIGVKNNAFPVLTDTDLGIGSTGRLVHNNNGTPQVVGNNDYVYYFVAIIVEINAPDRLAMYMGNAQYGTPNQARNNLEAEIATVESSLNIKQGVTLQFAGLYRTGNSQTNAVKAYLVEMSEINKEGSYASPISTIPDDLVNGGDASDLHGHDSKYGKFDFAISDETSVIEVGEVFNIRMARELTISSLYAGIVEYCDADITIDVKKNGTSILTTVLTIEAGDYVSNDATTQPVINGGIANYIVGDLLTVEILTAGTTGANLKMFTNY